MGMLLALSLCPLPVSAGRFIFTGPGSEDVVTHPTGYTGSAATLSVSVCIDPTSVNAADMEVPVQNAIDVWNGLVPTTGNIDSANVPFFEFDFESAALHEIGHCLGLGHPNLGALMGLTNAETESTGSTSGPDATFDPGQGADLTHGSDDDVRNDDANLHYFRKSNNNPFTVDSVFDSSSYSRSLADLPASDLYAANCDRSVGVLLGFTDTECAMQQGILNGESKRTLGHDDVATLRYGMSGVDRSEGTGDDYTVTLTYAGLTSSCDVVLGFDDTRTGFAVCSTSGTFLDFPDFEHAAITSAEVFFNTGTQMGNEFDWFFNPDRLGSKVPSASPSSLAALALIALAAGHWLLRRSG
jgi:hypothetical protein